jgi:uncharacterized membrane protein
MIYNDEPQYGGLIDEYTLIPIFAIFVIVFLLVWLLK